MRINPYYVSPEKRDYYQTIGHDDRPPNVVGHDPRKSPIKPYPKEDIPPIRFGDPRDVDFPKKELIRNLVIDPEKRAEALKAAQLEKESGAKEKPITDVLIKTTEAHQTAMQAPSQEESQVIAEAAAEEILKQDKKFSVNKLVKSSTFTLIVGVVITTIIFTCLFKKA